MNNILILVLLYSSSQVDYCDGHATLFKPPSRAYKWNFGFSGPVDSDHNGVNCGGREGIKNHEGKCGICGDSWDEVPPRKHEAPGKFAEGIVTGQYQPGKIVEVGVEVTANHLGFLQFAICANNRTDRDPDQSCFKKLEIVGSSIENIFKGESYPPYIRDIKTQLPIGTTETQITAKVKLPDDIKRCSRCILQMTYTAGHDNNADSCGVSCEPGVCKRGCGFQETFRGCADVSIMSENPDDNNDEVNSGDVETTSNPTTMKSDNVGTCVAIGPWAGQTAMDKWCETSCNWTPSICPADMCKC